MKGKAVGLITAHSWIGMSTPVINTAIYLADQGYQVDIFMNESKFVEEDLGIKKPQFENPNINVVSTIQKKKISLVEKGIAFFTGLKPADVRFVRNFRKNPKRKKYDFFIGYDLRGLARAAVLSFFSKTPFIFHSLELEKPNSFSYFDKKRAQKSLLSISQDEIRCDLLSLIFSLNREKVMISYNSPLGNKMLEKKNYFRETFSIPENKVIVLASGGLAKSHYIDKLLETVKDWPDEFVLVLHGWIPKKPLENEIRAYVKEFPNKIYLSTNFFSYQDKFELYQSVDIGLILFAHSDDFNVKYAAGSAGKLFDFFKVGVPIVANNVPGMQDWVVGKSCGVVFNEDIELVKCLQEVNENYDYYARNSSMQFDKYEFTNSYKLILNRIEDKLNLPISEITKEKVIN